MEGMPERALALMEGRSRDEVAAELGVSPVELSRLLAAARKALRRRVAALPSGGWCERAERLISDRLDGALSPRGAARLDAHLTACERCVTHERMLLEARDLITRASPEPDRIPEAAHHALALVVALVVIAVVVSVLAASGTIHHVP